MKKCTICGDIIYSSIDGPICYRCKDSGARVRLEIYDKEPNNSSQDSFSKVFLGGPNFRDMQRKNIRSGGLV